MWPAQHHPGIQSCRDPTLMLHFSEVRGYDCLHRTSKKTGRRNASSLPSNIDFDRTWRVVGCPVAITINVSAAWISARAILSNAMNTRELITLCQRMGSWWLHAPTARKGPTECRKNVSASLHGIGKSRLMAYPPTVCVFNACIVPLHVSNSLCDNAAVLQALMHLYRWACM
jgi:hypothetical protein